MSILNERGWLKPGRFPVLRVLTIAALMACAGIAGSAGVSVPIITTFAGGGTPASGNGDSGPATGARLIKPLDVAVDAAGNVYIADLMEFVGQDGNKVRRVDSSGVITTVAGNGSFTYNGDGIQATAAGISVQGIAVDGAGNLYIADMHNSRIRKVAPSGIISTVAGNGTAGFAGDGKQATAANLNFPSDVAVDAAGNLYILDSFNVRVRRVAVNGVITTIAGNGQSAFGADGNPATQVGLQNPKGIAVDAVGTLYIAEAGSGRVRKVGADGVISTLGGGGPFRSDPVAVNMKLLNPQGVAVDSRGNVYVAELNNLVRMISPAGIVKVVAGAFNDTTFEPLGAQWGFAGDGGPADQALLYEPLNLAPDAQGNLYIADSHNGRIRKVTPVDPPEIPAGLRAFRPYSARQVGSYSRHVAVADVTGDGRADALLTTSSWGGPAVEPENDMRLWLFVQQPDGNLAAPLKYPFLGDGARTGSGLATADLDRDGYMDAVVGTLNGVAIFRGHPGGFFPSVVSEGVANAQTVTSVAVIDVNRDGRLDIVTLGCCRAEGGSSPTDRYGMTVHYGNGAGGVASKVLHESAPGAVGENLKVADLNRDGLPDLIKSWIGPRTGGVDVLLHNGADGFMAPIRLTVPDNLQSTSGAYAIGDFNHDGLPDVVVSRGGNAPQASYVHFRQAPVGVFTMIRDWRAYDIPGELLGADMDGDARDDLLVVHGSWSSIGYMRQTDAGLDVEVKYHTVQSGLVQWPSLAAGDLDSDGCKDLAMADYNYGLIVLRGANCVLVRNGSQPRIPRKPVTTAGPPMQSMRDGMPATSPILSPRGATGAGGLRAYRAPSFVRALPAALTQHPALSVFFMLSMLGALGVLLGRGLVPRR